MKTDTINTFAEAPMKTTCQHPLGFHAACFGKHLLRLRSRGGFTLTELFVVIAIVAVLAATLLPALAASKDREKRAECASNLRQICVATFIYAADRNDYMPLLKWRDGNSQYPYEMFRYSPVNTPVNGTTSFYEAGPYNLGSLWKNNVLVDGKIYYCPADLNNDLFTYAYYSQKTNWPWVGDPAAINPDYVRAGYTYYPQSRNARNDMTAIGLKSMPFWPDPSTSPEPFRSWICVPPFKQTAIDQTKSMVVDVLFKGFSSLSHKSGNTVLGINAGFGDGHVAWQGFKVVTDGFNLDVWKAIKDGGDAGGINLRYSQSCWRP